MTTRTTTLTKNKVISFDEVDRDNVQDPHHYGLIITLYIANQIISRTVIDEESSVNLIQLRTLNKMNVPYPIEAKS